MKKLPKPQHKLGYPAEQLDKILKQLKITDERFNNVFGINTCAIDKDGNLVYYACDIERALWNLGHKLGKYHEWD